MTQLTVNVNAYVVSVYFFSFLNIYQSNSNVCEYWAAFVDYI